MEHKWIHRFCIWIENHFLWCIVITSIIAFFYPSSVTWLKPHIPKLLGVIMFGMGMTLTFNDFKRV